MYKMVNLEKAFAGPKDSKGRSLYPGFFFDTGIASTQGIPGLLHGGSSPTRPGVTVSEWMWIAPSSGRRPIRLAPASDGRAGQRVIDTERSIENWRGPLFNFEGVDAEETFDYMALGFEYDSLPQP
jgi:hypothetical protein